MKLLQFQIRRNYLHIWVMVSLLLLLNYQWNHWTACFWTKLLRKRPKMVSNITTFSLTDSQVVYNTIALQLFLCQYWKYSPRFPSVFNENIFLRGNLPFDWQLAAHKTPDRTIKPVLQFVKSASFLRTAFLTSGKKPYACGPHFVCPGPFIFFNIIDRFMLGFP